MLKEDDIQYLINTCNRAGSEILKVRNALSVSYKEDKSPVTQADINSNELIIKDLAKFGLPIISEETYKKSDKYDYKTYWLIDPLDGTKEFIKNRDEFTVNIALMDSGKPIFGFVSAPAKNEVWVGINSIQKYAFKINSLGEKKLIKCRKPDLKFLESLISMSHADQSHLKEFYQKNNLKVSREMPAGSSLKICYIAEGKADIYPRLGPTMEWDIAAANAVLEAAGGYVLDENNKALSYEKPCLLNGSFIATNYESKFKF